ASRSTSPVAVEELIPSRSAISPGVAELPLLSRVQRTRIWAKVMAPDAGCRAGIAKNPDRKRWRSRSSFSALAMSVGNLIFRLPYYVIRPEGAKSSAAGGKNLLVRPRQQARYSRGLTGNRKYENPNSKSQ